MAFEAKPLDDEELALVRKANASAPLRSENAFVIARLIATIDELKTQRAWPAQRAPSDDSKRGLYSKYIVKRSDGSSQPGGKHENCAYFVLDLDHDPYSRPALREYAKRCAKKFPELARDLRKIVRTYTPLRRYSRAPEPMFGREPETMSEMATDLMAKNAEG